MEYPDSDMLGHPIPSNFGGRGAPAYAPSAEDVSVVMALWARKKSNAYCAAALGISEPTFNKYFFKTKAQKAQRDQARAWVEGMTMRAVLKGVNEGNMAAVKQMREIMFRADQEELASKVANRSDDETPKRDTRGKKQRQRDEAAAIAGLYAPPSDAIN